MPVPRRAKRLHTQNTKKMSSQSVQVKFIHTVRLTQILPFCLCTQPQWIWNGRTKMRLKSRPSALWNLFSGVCWWCDCLLVVAGPFWNHCALPSAQSQPYAAKLIGWCFTVQMVNEPNHTAKATQELLKAKNCNILQWPSQSPELNPNDHDFHSMKTKLRVDRRTNKQQLKAAAVKAWQSIPGGNPHIYHYDVGLSNYFWAPESGGLCVLLHLKRTDTFYVQDKQPRHAHDVTRAAPSCWKAAGFEPSASLVSPCQHNLGRIRASVNKPVSFPPNFYF